jgi:hypothetical protein
MEGSSFCQLCASRADSQRRNAKRIRGTIWINVMENGLEVAGDILENKGVIG